MAQSSSQYRALQSDETEAQRLSLEGPESIDQEDISELHSALIVDNNDSTPHPSIPRGELRSSNGEEKSYAKKRRYFYASIALVVALFSFVLQTETAGYLANTLHYRKPIFTLYLTHSSWTFMWPVQIAVLRLRKLNIPTRVFIKRHIESQYRTALMVMDNQKGEHRTPARYFLRVCLILFLALNVAGSSWYIAVNWTTPNDLTAIYNCSAFFAYAFSVPLLKETFRYDKASAVVLSIVGVIVVAYAGSSNTDNAEDYPYRALGNLVIGVGAILYGLYEVLYKKLASPPAHVSAKKQAAFANVVGSAIGLFTMCLLWIMLPILHFCGVERLQLPTREQAFILFLSLAGNVLFSASFLILMSLTSPVLSSVAALLTTFLVPLVDWILFGTQISTGDVIGGFIIISAFALLSYASWLELQEEDLDDEDEDESNDSNDISRLH